MSDKFIFQNARIKSMELRLINSQQLQRIAECAGVFDAAKLLSEMGFGSGAGSEGDPDRMFAQEEEFSASVLRQFNADGALDALLLTLDYHNLKVALKAVSTGEKAPVFMPEGLIGIDKLRLGAAGERGGLRPGMVSVCEAVDRLRLEEKLTPRAIDTLTDKAMYADIIDVAPKGGRLMKLYFTRRIDLTNLASFMRCRKAGLPDKFFEDSFIEGGELDEELFLSVYESPVEAISDKCRFTPYRDAAIKAVEESNPVRFEVFIDNFLLGMWRERRNDMFSPAPIVGFYLAKQAELKAVKLLVAGIKNGVDSALIKERMREIYDA